MKRDNTKEMVKKPVLIAATLTESLSENILNALIEKFPGKSFSRILDGKSKTWKVHSMVNDNVTAEQIKRHCLKLMNELNN